MKILQSIFVGIVIGIVALVSSAASYPTPVEGDFVIKNFHFKSGEMLPELKIHYRTIGTPHRDASGVVRNAVLALHGTSGSGASLIADSFAEVLFGKGGLLDATNYFIILPDGIGHGKSSKPSDGLHAHFPHYTYDDMVLAQYELLTEGLGVNHLRLVIGTSMGGMHTWLWGEMHPEFMDALVPLASLPTQISGRNRVWRRIIIDAIRGAPDWQDGNYEKQPHGLALSAETLYFMSENPALRVKEAPTLGLADSLLNAYVAKFATNYDANDVLYAVEASRDYDPGPGLEKIKASLLAINSADDLINPPDQGVLEHEIKRVQRGRAIVIPESDQTVGHGSHTKAVLWKKYLARFLKKTEPR